jgi:hypothetical protein
VIAWYEAHDRVQRVPGILVVIGFLLFIFFVGPGARLFAAHSGCGDSQRL